MLRSEQDAYEAGDVGRVHRAAIVEVAGASVGERGGGGREGVGETLHVAAVGGGVGVHVGGASVAAVRYHPMMKPTVYIETTIPSYYCDGRADLMRDIIRTREWWDLEMDRYQCFLSLIVLDELEDGDYSTKQACLELVRELPLLEITSEIQQIADVYWANRLMPKPPVRDALHVATASFYRMDYLLTWNCRHLANINKSSQLDVINAKMHLGLPRMITPQQLRLVEDDS